MTGELHRIELETFDLEAADNLDAEAAQYRAAAAKLKRGDDRTLLLAEADAAEQRARTLRERMPLRGRWVDIKKRRTFGDSLRISAARVANPEPGVADNVLWVLTKMDRSIVAWSFGELTEPGDGPAIVPERRAAFEDLDSDIGGRLLAAIDAYYNSRRRTDDDTKASSSASSPPAPESRSS